MLPIKIRSYLIDTFDEDFYQFPPNSIINHLTKFDTKENIKRAINTSRRYISKIQFNHPDGKKDIIFRKIIDTRKIIRQIRTDNSKNYHDYLTIFNFKTDHPIYDLIVEVNYRYVYS